MNIDPQLAAVYLRMEALQEDASPRTRPRPPRYRRPPGRLRLGLAHLLVRSARRLIREGVPTTAPRN